MEWTLHKDNRLAGFIRLGLKIKTIAKIFKTTEEAIRLRLMGVKA